MSTRNFASVKRKMMEEVKVKLNGKKQRFEIEFWNQNEAFVVGRWVAPLGNPYGLPEGSFSFGVWNLLEQYYGSYRIHAPDGEIVSYRFDCVGNVVFERSGEASRVSNRYHARVSFEDLLLDAYVVRKAPSSRDDTTNAYEVRFEDEDELLAAIEEGELSEQQLEAVERFREELQAPGRIVSEIDRAIAEAAEKAESFFGAPAT